MEDRDDSIGAVALGASNDCDAVRNGEAGPLSSDGEDAAQSRPYSNAEWKDSAAEDSGRDSGDGAFRGLTMGEDKEDDEVELSGKVDKVDKVMRGILRFRSMHSFSVAALKAILFVRCHSFSSARRSLVNTSR